MPKPLFRVIAFDDGFFTKNESKQALLVGVVWRADNRIDGILSERISVDANDATEKISSLLNGSRFSSQVSCILLQGITFAGFNIVDMKALCKSTGKPVIAVFRKNPDRRAMLAAVKRFPDSAHKARTLKGAPKICSLGSLRFQYCGCARQEAEQVIKKCLLHSLIPEPIRIAHIIASGISIGKSTRP